MKGNVIFSKIKESASAVNQLRDEQANGDIEI